jgi:hypothetical protein
MQETTTLIEQLERAPSLVIPLVREVSPSLLKRRPSPTKWSAHEHACHLSRVDRLYVNRLEHILAHENPVITPYDPGRDDPDDVFLQMDLDDSLKRYVEERRALVSRLRELSPDVWARTAEHGEYSHYSVFIMFRHVALHDLFHAYRIEELLLRREWPPNERLAFPEWATHRP